MRGLRGYRGAKGVWWCFVQYQGVWLCLVQRGCVWFGLVWKVWSAALDLFGGSRGFRRFGLFGLYRMAALEVDSVARI